MTSLDYKIQKIIRSKRGEPIHASRVFAQLKGASASDATTSLIRLVRSGSIVPVRKSFGVADPSTRAFRRLQGLEETLCPRGLRQWAQCPQRRASYLAVNVPKWLESGEAFDAIFYLFRASDPARPEDSLNPALLDAPDPEY